MTDWSVFLASSTFHPDTISCHLPLDQLLNMKSAIAIAAHPDDIEFQMAGALLLRMEAGWETEIL